MLIGSRAVRSGPIGNTEPSGLLGAASEQDLRELDRGRHCSFRPALAHRSVPSNLSTPAQHECRSSATARNTIHIHFVLDAMTVVSVSFVHTFASSLDNLG